MQDQGWEDVRVLGRRLESHLSCYYLSRVASSERDGGQAREEEPCTALCEMADGERHTALSRLFTFPHLLALFRFLFLSFFFVRGAPSYSELH